MGVWLLYYLQFTNYAGVGLLETVMVATYLLTEIPTGAITDLFGKKRTLFLAFLLSALGNVIMGFAGSAWHLAVSIVISTTAHSFYSGTFEALQFDTLVDAGKEKLFDKVVANGRSAGLVASALASIVGGFIYMWQPSAPFLLLAVVHFLALIPVLLVTEPKVDTVKFSFKSYVDQTKKGFSELFSTEKHRTSVLLLLVVGVVSYVAYQMIVEAFAVELGYQGYQLGFLMAAAFLVSAVASQITPRLTLRLAQIQAAGVVGFVMAGIFLLFGVAGFWMGGLVVLLWSGTTAVFNNLESVVINKQTRSAYRATTLSTYSFLKSIPYLFVGYGLGALMDRYSVALTGVLLGVVLLVGLVLLISVNSRVRQLLRNSVE